MTARSSAALATVAALCAIGAPAASGAANPAPAWRASSLATPTNFVPGDTAGEYFYEVRATNDGAAATNGGPVTITDVLPAGLTVVGQTSSGPEPCAGCEFKLRFVAAGASDPTEIDFGPSFCTTEEATGTVTVSCTIPSEIAGDEDEPSVIDPSEQLRLVIHVEAPAAMPGGEELLNTAEVAGGGASTVSASSRNATAQLDSEGHPIPASRGFSYYRALLTGPDGQGVDQAALAPYQYTTTFALNTKPGPPGNLAAFVPAGGDPKDIRVALPPGFVGNPTAASRCTAQQFTTISTIPLGTHSSYEENECPDGSAIGFVSVEQLEGSGGVSSRAVYNLVPPPGVPAQLGFVVGEIPFYIDAEVRTGSDYGIDAVLHNSSQVKRLTAASVTIWGTPADTRHDPLRGRCLNEVTPAYRNSLGICHAGVAPKRFLRLPTSCEDPLNVTMSFDTWSEPGSFLSQTSGEGASTGCAPLPFTPTISAIPTTTVADSPSGLSFNLHLPQNEDPNALATADLRDLTVTLPQGVSVNPASAGGLVGCTPAQLELHGPKPAQCPDASKIGSVEVHTPLLDHPVDGAVYVASQSDNPFGSLIAIYVTAFDKQTGVVLKLAGKVEPDPSTGQLKATFTDNPQLPFEDLTTRFFEGPRAPLRTPLTCGRYRTTTDMMPWSAPDSGPDATPSDSFDVTTAPAGGACAASEATAPNKPSFQAGTITPIAGSFSPFVLNLSRSDGSQYIHGIDVALPPGLTGKLAGIPYCPEAALAAAVGRAGRAEQSSPSCPAGSQVGSVDVAAGAGPSPIQVGGKAYLAGPYKGAPLSLAVITPAVAGPFDLGTVVVRAALRVDPRTAQVTAVSDPLPTILQGIPLDLRSVSLAMNRPDFMLNPTDCEPMAIDGREISLANQAAPLASRFQVGACAALGFKPKLGLSLTGGARRGAHPKLKAILKPRAGDANAASAVVALPHSEFLDQGHIKTICTRVQFAAGAGEGADCPAGSVYGHAVATTPLLDQPLEGPVFLRSSNHNLPDLAMALHGQIDVELSGRIDSVHGGIRTSFEAIPDAPVSKFVLTMKGGKKGLLVNSRDVCAGSFVANAKFGAQNGRAATLRPALKNSSCGKKRRRR
jgi:uncharacterized repeat protein (TIGR01451 family)